MDVECKNNRCKHCDVYNNLCLLFKLRINEEGQCASFEEAKSGDGSPN